MANEKRLIDANAVLRFAKYDARLVVPYKHTADDILAMVKTAPTVDAVEVVHGRWVQMEFWPGGGTWRCSECGYQVMFMEDTPYAKAMHYCPHCGAKMDGGNEDGNL